jgi:DNA-binding response OmpR family regulator
MGFPTFQTNLRTTTTRAPLTARQGVDLDVLYDAQHRQRILIVDDDADTITLLKEILRAEGYDVFGAMSTSEAIQKATDLPPHLILLDLMMPDHDGWETFNDLRKVTSAPVIVVSARDNKDDIVRGLHLGIDDYLTKPFFNAEVIARIKTVLRRAKPEPPIANLYFPDVGIKIDVENQEVIFHNRLVRLTPREFEVLVSLARHAPKSVSHTTIARDVWGEDSPSARKRIKYLVYLLRKKMEKSPAEPRLIISNEAYGYRLNASPHGATD